MSAHSNANGIIVTPASVEKRLLDLSREVDQAHEFLDKCEEDYYNAKAGLEIALATVRVRTNGSAVKYTVRDKEDYAVLECADLIRAVAIAEAKVRAARANTNRIRTQVDIARSIGTSVRASMEI